MKKDIWWITMTGYLVILLLCPILYWIIIQPRISYDWWYYSEVYYPRQIVDRLADCLFGIHLFFFGYLFFEKKHYAARIGNQDKEKTRRWMRLAALCQLGAFGVYAVLWLEYTRTFYMPVQIPTDYLSQRYLEDEKFWYRILPEIIVEDELFNIMKSDYIQAILSLTVLIPIILYLIAYLAHFLVRWRQYKKRGCISIGWRRWNLTYIACVGIILFWACDSQMLFPILEKIPILRQLVPLLMPPG